MVHSKMTLSVVSALAAVAAVGAQSTTTASLFEAIFDSVDLAGSIAGVGADGTTYVLSADYTVEADDDTTIAFPITMTLVEDATHVSEAVNVAITGVPSGLGIGDGAMSIGAECNIANGEAVCTEHAAQGTLFSSDDIETLSATLGPVPVVVAAVTGSSSKSASTPGATTSASGAAYGHTIAKVLVGGASVGAMLAVLL